MSEEVIQFPGNRERYLILAQESLEQGKIQQSLAHYEKAYELGPDFMVNYMMAEMYLEEGNAQRARALVDEYAQSYKEMPQLIGTYIKALGMTGDEKEAHYYLDQQLEHCHENERLYWEHMKKWLSSIEDKRESVRDMTVDVMEQNIKVLAKGSLWQQSAYVQKLLTLPQKDITRLAQIVLKDGAIHPLVRASVLEQLVKMNFEEKVTIITFDGKRTYVRPSHLPLILESPIYQKLKDILQRSIMDVDPLMYRNIAEELELHVAMLYPFAEQAIKSPEKWIRCYLTRYADNFFPFDEAEKADNDLYLAKCMQQNLSIELEK